MVKTESLYLTWSHQDGLMDRRTELP